MSQLNPWKFGAVLSVTVSINYVLCTALFLAFPRLSIDFLNALFHSVDFSKIYAAAPYSPGSFAYTALVLAVWSYVIGAIYALTRNRLRPDTDEV